MQSIYIILSQSGTDISKLLKFVTREKYNHASICITDDFTKFYSFGRKKINNPLIGGFLIENAFEHVFGKFNYVPCLILELKINDDQYIKIESLINDFIKKSDSLSYDFLALFLAKTPLSITNDSKYFCSQFVAKILNDIGISTPKNQSICIQWILLY